MFAKPLSPTHNLSTCGMPRQIRRFIRNWRKVKEIRDREKAIAAGESQQQLLKQVKAEGQEEEGEEEFQEPIPQGGSYPLPMFSLLVRHKQGCHSQ